VQLSERQLTIEIQRDEKMFARPFDSRSFCHTAKLPDTTTIANHFTATIL
jgi:HSP20 family molecular chaperone IbpA